MKAPFPWFGNKRRIAHAVWQHFGNVKNYIEPFFGSGAVLLNRPHVIDTQKETINDNDGYVVNFWRAVKADWKAVAEQCDWPVHELDLHARHRWLVEQKPDMIEMLETDPEDFDSKIAGWWAWGLCCWIGGQWCEKLHKRLPMLSSYGQGVTAFGFKKEILHELSERLRRVRVCYGDWRRVIGSGSLSASKDTAIFLDPPYSTQAKGDTRIYTEGLSVAHECCAWAIEHGDRYKIAMCGYENEHVFPDSWECIAWKTKGGYSQNGSQAQKNSARERIWFSPKCLKSVKLFEEEA